ncbi:AAA family ATPase [Parabacteroides sp. AGMB00274]|uniref:AAA family ATPase n=1 Tax=Parabacteroides faecalis TaxID=2924040 RepID=A0ABT0BZC3_9BACT|nr:AAA family ATPase [Parabacteroides faecalis]MCJ2379985.1 AAA family ATPase [Parabacteroides faecalis]
MNYFIKNIHVNELFHLKNFDIPIADEQAPHLMITGKNGSGKTVLLNAIADFLERIKDDKTLDFTKYEVNLNYLKRRLDDGVKDDKELMSVKNGIDFYEMKFNTLYGKVKLDFVNVVDIINAYKEGNFIIAFYQAARKPEMIEPESPTKPTYEIKGAVKKTVTNQFLNFLSDLKIQEALARNEGELKDAELINKWFINFENLLKQIYDDKELRLKFNHKNYSFLIQTEGKEFRFTQLSDGYAAILDIVVDLILKMQGKDNLIRAYQKEGIVLIDEVETHLHLELQKMIMPFLTKVFPNIQFIITTHSPFVLNSLDNAVAFDLEHRETINELTQYSYETLAEGYFGVSSDSSYMQMQLERLESLLQKESLTDSDKYDIRQLVEDLNKVPESVSPNLVGTYMAIRNRYASVLKTVLP